MADYYVLDNGNPIVQVKASEDGPISAVSKVDDNDWQFDAAKEYEGEMTLSQLVRYFGRYAGSMTVEDYSKRRVAKRGEEPAPAEVNLQVDGEIVKTDPAQQIVFGWAYVVKDSDGVQVVDKSGDFIDEVEEIEKSAYDYVLRSRQSDADHTNVKGGEMVESMVFTPEKIEKMGLPANSIPLGWWVGYKIEDKATWERVEKGELRSFSIHGAGTRTKVAPE